MKTVLGLTCRSCLMLLILALLTSITYAARRNSSIKIRHGRPKTERRRPFTDDYDYELDVSDEKRLTKFLYQRYSRLGRGGRPVVNSSQVVLVRFGLAMIQMDLDERQNMLTSSDWCRYRWIDEYLRWNPEDFGHLRSVRMSSNRIWIPDIMLYNTAHTQKLERDVLAVVKYTGEVQWIPHRTYKASCAVDVRNFPFDIQTCHMTFGSWSYHGNEIDLGHLEDMEMLDVSDLERESTAWDIIDKTENRKSSYYDCCSDPYVTLTFTLRLKRKLVFSSFILTLPCIFLACMTLVVFWLPPERPDRTSLAMSLFASFLLLLLILVEAAPPTASSIPTLGVYYCFNMVVIMLSIFLSSVVINISRRGINMTPVPRWLQSPAMNRLSRLLCVTIQQHPRPRAVLRNLVSQGLLEGQNVIANEELTIPLRNTRQENGGLNECCHRNERGAHSGSSADRSKGDVVPLVLAHDSHIVRMLIAHFFKMEKCLHSIDTHLKEVMASMQLRDVSKEMRDLKFGWQTIAMTMDRMLFLLFLLAILISLLLLFPRPEQFAF